MGWHYFGVLVAGFGAILHIGFAYTETLGWNREFVGTAAPSWIESLDEDLSLAGMLGTFFAIWLLAAAAAALHTQVYLAAKWQGGLGLVLLWAAW